MESLICQIKGYIQPFERTLALQEMRALTDGPVVPVDGDFETAAKFSIAPNNNVEVLRSTLAYWHSVGDQQTLTDQLRSEATQIIARNRNRSSISPQFFPETTPPKLPNRRYLRYATHGLHEYRGKFFPQLVRALMNIAQLDYGATVLDPMCGSGTTLVEARLSGRNSLGIDMNPLSVFMSDVKCRSLTLTPASLANALNLLEQAILGAMPDRLGTFGSASLTHRDQIYLERWFSQLAILELDQISQVIRQLPVESTLKDFYRIALSNILRKISWQKDEDLRVRRLEHEFVPGTAKTLFLEQARRSTNTLATFLAECDPGEIGSYQVREADARGASNVFPDTIGNVDAVITSPPYATALPYIDTDRLSLIYFGLLRREDHRTRDSQMIGNREVSRRERNGYWGHYERNRLILPGRTRNMIEKIDRLNREGAAGFRRRNLPALLSKYFFDMRETMQQMFALLRPGGSMFMVVGNNRTTAGGQHVDIDTPDHLAIIATNIGFQKSGEIPMEMLIPRSIFRKNAVASECILRFEKHQ